MSTSLSEALGKGPSVPEPVEMPEVEAEAAQAEAAQPEQAEPEPPVEAQPEKEPAKPEAHMVPVDVVKALRDEIRALKSQIPERKPDPLPDVLDDSEGFANRLRSETEQQLLHMRLNMSEEMVRTQMGDAAVDAALAAFEPHIGTQLHGEIMQSRNPYKAMMDWHAREQARAEIGDDPASYKARLEAEIRAKLESELVTKEIKASPPSLASSTNSGSRAGPAWAPTSLEAALKGARR